MTDEAPVAGTGASRKGEALEQANNSTRQEPKSCVSGDDERFLVAYVTPDAKVVGIEHPTEADWHAVRAAHVALRDRINERLAAEDACPFKPALSQPQPVSEIKDLARSASPSRELATEPAPASKWRTIESAPRDGRELLLIVERRAGIPGKALVGHFMPGGHCIEDHPAIRAGWYFWNGYQFDDAAKPTHWQPLPEPPNA